MEVHKVDYNNYEFTVVSIKDVYYIPVKELMDFCHIASKQRFYETLKGQMPSDEAPIFMDVDGKEQELIAVSWVMAKAFKGKSKFMLGLTKWLMGVFEFRLKKPRH